MLRLSGWIIVVIGLLTAGLLVITWPSAAQEIASEIQVGVVIQGPDGQPEAHCVTLEGENSTGEDALRATGLDILLEESSRGVTVCKVGATGCNFPDEHCFCQCEGGDICAYWSYFHRSEAGTWQYSAMGAQAYTVTQGSVEMWWWRDSSQTDADPPPTLTFDQICNGAPADSAFPRIVIDGMDREVTIPAPPQNIASVPLGSDEILLEMVGPERLLGVTYFAADPTISNIADQLDAITYTDLIGNPEYLVSLDADLVILAAYNNPAALDQLLDADVPVFVLNEFNTLDDIRTNIRLLGQAVGAEAQAETMIADMDAQIAAIQDKVKDQEPVRVLYYEPGGITYGPGSTVDEIIRLAGGVNVIDDPALGPYPLINAEFVLASDPDVILLGGWFADQDDPLAAFMADDAFRTLRAVQNGRVIPVSDAHMTNVSQYVVRGIEDVARALYPDAFR